MRYLNIFIISSIFILGLIILILAEGARAIYSGLFFIGLAIVILREMIKKGKINLKRR